MWSIILVKECFCMIQLPHMLECKNCQSELSKWQKTYCSNKCQQDFQYKKYIDKWKAGLVSGSRGISTKNFSGHIIRYLHEISNGCCSLCGWGEINPRTGRCPLELDHIDGDPDNNTEGNLRLLCPNCHSLTPTYRNLNFGNGRLWRREKYVKMV